MAGYIGSQTPVVSNGSQRKYTFTATAAQTVFTGMDIPNPQQIQVFQNGVRLVITTDYTVSSGTTVTLVNAASAGDSLVVILFADYQLLDTDALTFTGGTTIEGDLTVDTNTLYVDSTNNNVGIGTSSPAAALHVNSNLANLAGLFESNDAGATITLIDNSTTGGSVAEHGLNTVGDQLELRAVDNLAFETAATERMRIDSSGNVGIGTTSVPSEARAMVSGGRFYVNSQDQYSVLLQNGGTSGGFIGTTGGDTINFFSSGGTERLRILSSGGITFNGDTAAANALDDYEEGTFTPTSTTDSGTAATFGTVSGNYTKIGNVVYFNIDVTNIDTTGTTFNSQLRIDGLPFTVDVDTVRAAVLWDNITFQSTRTSCVATISSAEYIVLTQMGTGIGDTTVDYGDLSSGATDVFITGFYYTNQ